MQSTDGAAFYNYLTDGVTVTPVVTNIPFEYEPYATIVSPTLMFLSA